MAFDTGFWRRWLWPTGFTGFCHGSHLASKGASQSTEIGPKFFALGPKWLRGGFPGEKASRWKTDALSPPRIRIGPGRNHWGEQRSPPRAKATAVSTCPAHCRPPGQKIAFTEAIFRGLRSVPSAVGGKGSFCWLCLRRVCLCRGSHGFASDRFLKRRDGLCCGGLVSPRGCLWVSGVQANASQFTQLTEMVIQDHRVAISGMCF